MSLQRLQDAFVIAGLMIGLLGLIASVTQERPLARATLRAATGAALGMVGGAAVGVGLIVFGLGLNLAAGLIALAGSGIHYGMSQVATSMAASVRLAFYVAGAGLLLGLAAGVIWNDTGPRARQRSKGIATRRNLWLLGGGLASLLGLTVLIWALHGRDAVPLESVLICYALCAGAVMDGPKRAAPRHSLDVVVMTLIALVIVASLRALPTTARGYGIATAAVLLAAVAAIYGQFGYFLFNTRGVPPDVRPSRMRMRVLAWSLVGLVVGALFSRLIEWWLPGGLDVTSLGCVVGTFVALGDGSGRAALTTPKERFVAMVGGGDDDREALGAAGLEPDGISTISVKRMEARFVFDRIVARHRFWNSFFVGLCYVSVAWLLIAYDLVIVRHDLALPEGEIGRLEVYFAVVAVPILLGILFGVVFGILNGYRNAVYHRLKANIARKPVIMGAVLSFLGVLIASLPALVLYLLGADG
jgi:hypothetical protein